MKQIHLWHVSVCAGAGHVTPHASTAVKEAKWLWFNHTLNQYYTRSSNEIFVLPIRFFPHQSSSRMGICYHPVNMPAINLLSFFPALLVFCFLLTGVILIWWSTSSPSPAPLSPPNHRSSRSSVWYETFLTKGDDRSSTWFSTLKNTFTSMMHEWRRTQVQKTGAGGKKD